jgi:hypothetical protein
MVRLEIEKSQTYFFALSVISTVVKCAHTGHCLFTNGQGIIDFAICIFFTNEKH